MSWRMTMKKKIILTKKRLQTLHAALSVDDILYERFRRLHEELYRESERLIENKKRLWGVTKINQNGTLENLHVVDVKEREGGMEVFVK